MAAPVPFVQPAVPFPIFLFPVTAYSISYDIFTRRNEDDAPDGWHSRRANIYKRLAENLVNAGFARDQYSDWVNPFIHPADAYNTMTGLEEIPPPNKLSSTVRRLRMNRVDPLALLDVTESITLGGNFSTILRGPVPTNLVLPVAGAIVPIPGPIPPGAPFALPVDSRPGGASNPANFWM